MNSRPLCPCRTRGDPHAASFRQTHGVLSSVLSADGGCLMSPDTWLSEPCGLPLEPALRRRIPGGGGPLKPRRCPSPQEGLPSFLAEPASPGSFSGAPYHKCSRRCLITFRSCRRGALRRAPRSERSERRRQLFCYRLLLGQMFGPHRSKAFLSAHRADLSIWSKGQPPCLRSSTIWTTWSWASWFSVFAKNRIASSPM